MKRIFQLALTVAIVALVTPHVNGQANFLDDQFAQDNQWANDNNWDIGFTPDPAFQSTATVGATTLGAALTADVQASGTISAPTVVLGSTAGTSGTLTIPAGSSFTTVADLGTGDFQVGLDGGTGVLNVGGALAVAGQLESTTSASAASAINLNGSASVTVGTAFFDKQLNVNSNTASLNATGVNADGNSIVLGLGGTHSWTIPAAGAALFSAAGNVDLGGTLRVDFPDGLPAVGSTFDLFDAASIDANDPVPSGFGFIDASSAGPLGLGQRFNVQTVAGGANGVLGQLVLEQQPVLIVDRQSGQVQLQNPGSAASIGIDVYAIGSQLGALNPANWNSLQDQSALGGNWFEANPSANLISELEPNASGSIAANTSVNLGAIFALPTPTEFGVDNEDLTFQIARPGGGLINGDIIYTGLSNSTLTLNVDPATGEAQLVNGTSFTVQIDAYVVSSESGSLDTAQWDSLEDQGASGGNWFEANSDAEQLSELLIEGGLELAPNATVNLGFLFEETAGLEDLDFQFALVPTEDSSEGDFNADGIVSAADYVVWRDVLGSANDDLISDNGDGIPGVNGDDLNVWVANFGATGGSGAPAGPAALLTGKVLYSSFSSPSVSPTVATPEPGALLIAITGALLLSAGRCREV